MAQLPDSLRRQAEAEKIRIVAFFGIKRQGEPPFFVSAIAPCEPDEGAGAILCSDKLYAVGEIDDPGEAMPMLRHKLYGGL